MNRIKSISIPQPCHESWQQMTPVDQGRHCAQCCKTVTDFTRITDEQIINYLSSSHNVCGRFDQHQLTHISHSLYTKSLSANNWWKRALVVLGMLGPISLKVNGQTRPAIVNAPDTSRKVQPENFTLGKVAVKSSVMISGKVIAKDDGLPIPGAVIKIKGTNTVVLTNTAGKFTINVPAPGAILVVSFVGYDTQQIPVTNKIDKQLDIVMQSTSTMLGEVVVVVKTVPKFKKALRRVKGYFGEVRSELAIDSNNMRSPYF